MVSKTLIQQIDEACSPDRRKADFALNLDICDVVKAKIANARTAVNHIAKLINDPSPMRCYLALNLLDLLVINCGYPVHLMVAKKDFLNKLVYRFPSQPDEPLDKCHYIIMALLAKWSVALCERSKYGGDFGNIKLMLSLLKNKGFSIPEVEPATIDAIVVSEEASLRSKEDLEAEERLVHETRLEELLHRGTPADLIAANELMKKLIGYTGEGVSAGGNYSSSESRIDHELNLLAEKIDLLESMQKQDDRPEEYQQLFKECKDLVPRLFHLANSELSEPIMMKLLLLNQRLHEVVGIDESSPSLKNASLNMDMLIDLDKSCDELEEKPVVKPEVSIQTKSIMELYKCETPKLGPLEARIEQYTGGTEMVVDILSVNHNNYLRVFNANEAHDLKGVEVGGQTVGTISALSTLTIKLNTKLEMVTNIRYQLNGRQITEKLTVMM